MKNIKLKLIISFLLLSIVFITSCQDDEMTAVPLENIELSKSNIVLGIDEIQAIIVNAYPENSTEIVVWSSSNESVAEIQFSDNGMVLGVKGLSVGSAILTASVGSIVKNVNVEVIRKIEDIKLEIVGGVPNENVQSVFFEVIFTPNDATILDVIWESSDPEVASVDDNGLVTALSPGVATISVTSVEGSKTSSVEINVAGDPALLIFQYCTVSASGNYNSDEIKTSGGSTNISYSGGIPANNYEFISGQMLTIERGSVFNLAIKNSNGWSRSIAWIDWNGDLTFDDNGEQLPPFSPEKYYSGDPGETYDMNISVPESAIVGQVRVRILTGDAWYYNDGGDPGNGPGIPTNPCGVFRYSTFKDFIINIQ